MGQNTCEWGITWENTDRGRCAARRRCGGKQVLDQDTALGALEPTLERMADAVMVTTADPPGFDRQ
jgi:hypothetical protein